MFFSKSIMAAALLAASATAQEVKVHVVKVSGTTNSLTFSPSKLEAAVGEMVQFQFGVGNHSVTQSSFDAPCVPIGDTTDTVGVHSGFMPVKEGDSEVPTYTIPIEDEKPLWLYCANGKHCQNGMVMVINEPIAKNATRSLENYIESAAAAPANIAPSTGPTNGEEGTATPGDDADAGAPGYGAPGYGSVDPTGGDDSTPTGGDDASPTEEGNVISTGAASSMYAPTMTGVLVMVAAFLL